MPQPCYPHRNRQPPNVPPPKKRRMSHGGALTKERNFARRHGGGLKESERSLVFIRFATLPRIGGKKMRSSLRRSRPREDPK